MKIPKAKLPERPAYLLYELKPLEHLHCAILCLDCGWIRASWNRHDYRTCPCPNQAMVDGGFDYTRYGAMKMDRIQLVQIVPTSDKFSIKVKKKVAK